MKTRLKYYMQVVMHRYYTGKWPKQTRKEYLKGYMDWHRKDM